MAYLTINNVRYAGVSVCVPKNIEDNLDYPYLTPDERQNYVDSTGVRFRHCTTPDICTSDLCCKAAEQLLVDLHWDKSEVEALVFVSQTPDYRMPSTACVLQDRLGLPNNCLSFDVSLGCSGFVYGISILSGMMESGKIKKALLLVGNTQTKNINQKDKSSCFLFSDAGSASALEYQQGTAPMLFSLQTFGAGKESIIILDGGYRNMYNKESVVESEDKQGNIRNRTQLYMNGEEVFQFVMMKVVGCLKNFISEFKLSDDRIDYYLLHHASMMACQKIHKKLKLDDSKVPYQFYNYGNSSNASVPLLMVENIREKLRNGQCSFLFTGFGVGLSFGVGYITCDNMVVSEMQYL